MLVFSFWLYRLTVRTDPSQGLNRGSIPRRVTFNSAHEKRTKTAHLGLFLFSISDKQNPMFDPSIRVLPTNNT